MSRSDLSRSSKGLWQHVEAYMRSMLPRQARVTRAEGNSVWVKFLGDEASAPESKFVSTVAGVPAATMGWVFTLGGKKGLFIATGMQRRIPKRGEGVGIPGGNTVSTAGTYPLNSSLVTWTGLNPNRTYWAEWTVTINASGVGANPRGYFGVRASHAGGDSVYEVAEYHSQAPASANSRRIFSYTDARELQPSSEGVISIVPTFRWGTEEHAFRACTIIASVE